MREEVYNWFNECCRNFGKQQTFPLDSKWRSLAFWQEQCAELIKYFPSLTPKNPQTFGDMVRLWVAAPQQRKYRSRRLLYPGSHQFIWKNPGSHITHAAKPKFLHVGDLNGVGDAIFEVTNMRVPSSRFDGIARPKQHMEDWLKEKCRGNPPVVSM